MRPPTTAARDAATSPAFGRTGRFGRGVDGLTDLLARHQILFLAVASAVYFWITVYRAQRRLFWADEIFTYYISRLPDLRSVWSTSLQGVDFNPPLFYFLTRGMQAVFGANEVGTRFLETLGFWIFCVCLYRFVASRTNALAGFIALLYPLTCGAYWYAYEARPQGAVIGFFGLALVSWQAAANGTPRRWVALAGLAASLTCASLCHAYAFLLFIPLGFGELTRTLLRRRIDFGVWCALIFPAGVALAAVLPLLRVVHGIPAPVEFGSQLMILRLSWEQAINPSLALAILLVLAVPAILPANSGFALDSGKEAEPRWSFAWHERAAIAAILLTPVFAFLAARITHAPVYPRYSLIVTGGVAALIAAECGRRARSGLLILAMALLNIADGAALFAHASVIDEPFTGTLVSTRPPARTFAWMSATAPGSEPIAVLEGLSFPPLLHYAPPALRPRMMYLDRSNRGELYTLAICCGAPGVEITRRDFLARYRSFFLYGSDSMLLGHVDFFRRIGGKVTDENCDAGQCLVHLVLPPNPAANEAAALSEKTQ